MVTLVSKEHSANFSHSFSSSSHNPASSYSLFSQVMREKGNQGCGCFAYGHLFQFSSSSGERGLTLPRERTEPRWRTTLLSVITSFQEAHPACPLRFLQAPQSPCWLDIINSSLNCQPKSPRALFMTQVLYMILNSSKPNWEDSPPPSFIYLFIFYYLLDITVKFKIISKTNNKVFLHVMTSKKVSKKSCLKMSNIPAYTE